MYYRLLPVFTLMVIKKHSRYIFLRFRQNCNKCHCDCTSTVQVFTIYAQEDETKRFMFKFQIQIFLSVFFFTNSVKKNFLRCLEKFEPHMSVLICNVFALFPCALGQDTDDQCPFFLSYFVRTRIAGILSPPAVFQRHFN